MLKKIYILIFLLTTLAAAYAQDNGKGIPLFDNIQSDDKNGVKTEYDTELKVAVPQSLDAVKVSETVNTMKSLYNAGKVAEVIQLAELRKQFFRHKDKEMCEFMIYRLSALKDGGFDRKADSLTISFRKKFPFYKIAKSDPKVFRDLMQNYYTRPVFAFGAAVSKLYPMIKIDTVFNIAQDDTAKRIKYSDMKYRMSEVFLQWYITQNFSMTVSAAFSTLEYTRRSGNTAYTDKTSFFYIPARFSYAFRPIFTDGLVPEIFLGAKNGFVRKKEYQAEVSVVEERGDEKTTSLFQSAYRPCQDGKYFNCTIFGGARLNYNFNRFCVFIEGSYGSALKPLAGHRQRNDDGGMSLATGIVPDVVRVRESGISAGVKVNFLYRTFTRHDYGY